MELAILKVLLNNEKQISRFEGMTTFSSDTKKKWIWMDMEKKNYVYTEVFCPARKKRHVNSQSEVLLIMRKIRTNCRKQAL